MNRRKLTGFERWWLRHQRIETQLIRARAKERNFDYVVNPPDEPRVVFGSSQHREVMPLRGPQLPQIMRKTLGEYREYPGPTDYKPEIMWDLNKDYPSKLGFSSFCSKLPRLPATEISPYPPLGTYEVDPIKPIKPDAKPFGFHEPQESNGWQTPGPPTYPIEKPLREYSIASVFSCRRTIYPAIAIFCAPINLAQCIHCNELPLGDYWHNFETEADICRPCMLKEKATMVSCSTKPSQRILMKRDIASYARVRYCGFYHDHNGTDAAIPLISKKRLQYKIRKENYLSLYID